MNLKTYQAATMAEALAAVKRDLGRDAVILHTRNFRKGGVLGLFGGRSMWEITASQNVNVPQRMLKGGYVSDQPPWASQAVHPPAQDSPADGAGPAVAPQQQLAQEMTELRRLVEALVAHRSALQSAEPSAQLQEFQEHLRRQDVEEEIATDLIRQLRMNLTGSQLADKDLIGRSLVDLIASRIRVAGNHAQEAGVSRGRVMALIGPTGVGKTTTVAKLAANFKLREGRRVGLITIDTYRIAAVDQLKTYAEIIEVPLRAVLTADELRQAVQAMRDMDVVLIDTAGRSQNDRLRLSQLRRFLEAARADEVHLVISAAANRICIRNTLGRFSPLGVNRVIITKLDEAETFGAVLNIAASSPAAMSYITTGQEVPDDIAVADPCRLARWITGGKCDAN